MNYLVMEVHPAYAVVLDEEGRFLKAANLRYQVGDTVRSIVELRPARNRPAAWWKPLAGLAAAAACFCLVFFGYYQPNYTPYGTLRIQINPDVELTVSRTDRVLELEGLNPDGEELIEGYSYQGKDRQTAANELVERAIAMGYLSSGDTVSITVSSSDADWQAREEARTRAQLEERYGETIVIRLGEASGQPEPQPPEETAEIVIPISPQTPTPAPVSTPTPVPTPIPGDTDYGPNADGVTDYDDTDYGPNADGVTDYDDTGDGPYTDGVTDYEDRGDGEYGDDGGDDDDDGDDDDRDDDGDDDDRDDDDRDDDDRDDDDGGDD